MKRKSYDMPVWTPAATTLANLADRAPNALSDSGAATWPQATIEEWCLEAIRDYSVHFPLLAEADINCVTGTHIYDLPDDLIAVVKVEYPQGEDPPQFLARYDHQKQDFWSQDGYYDYQPSGAPMEPGDFFISDDVTTGEKITVTYTTAHEDVLASGGTIDVPTHHEHILILFVVWKALDERLAAEAQNPDTTIRLMQQLAHSRDEAHYNYLEALKTATKAEAPGGWTGPWESDDHDRIY